MVECNRLEDNTFELLPYTPGAKGLMQMLYWDLSTINQETYWGVENALFL